MRVHVTGNYDIYGSYILRYTGEGGGPKGEIYKIIAPDAVFRIGSSIGGYWAKPAAYAGQHRLALIRLSGSERRWPVDLLRATFGNERGFVLMPGMTGLWAESAGSAKRGVFHPVREETNPVKRLLRGAGIPSTNFVVVDKIDHDVPDTCSASVFDGEDVYVHNQPYWVHVIGGTFLIIASTCSKVKERVIVTPAADLDMVTEMLNRVMDGASRLVKAEIAEQKHLAAVKRIAEKADREARGIMF